MIQLLFQMGCGSLYSGRHDIRHCGGELVLICFERFDDHCIRERVMPAHGVLTQALLYS